MMAGRPHDAEGVPRFPLHHGVHRIQHATDGPERYVERARADLRVAGGEGMQPWATSRRTISMYLRLWQSASSID